MFSILEKKVLAPRIKSIKVYAPLIAKKFKPGQFVILRLCEEGERIPLTIVDADKDSIILIFQEVGKTTMMLGKLEVGDTILDLVGPLGNPSEIKRFGNVCCVGGGVGIIALYPITRALRDAGNKITTIIGARSKDLLI
ncbi:MAG: sulfide/dihydroorotate dehydrogenase-like FAD/NAD-binding protein, partial [Nitrososphaerales archaeon]